MSETYQSFYQNEKRALQITINDQDGAQFQSEAASASVVDINGTTVVDWQAASVVSNTVNTIIGPAVTRNTGSYKVYWRLTKDGYVYYHVTELEVMEL